MSERGTFVTEFVYCPKCFKAAQEVLKGDHKFLCSRQISEYPVLAGKIGGLYPGEELDTFRDEFIPELEKEICHPLRIAMLAEEGEEVFRIEPK